MEFVLIKQVMFPGECEGSITPALCTCACLVALIERNRLTLATVRLKLVLVALVPLSVAAQAAVDFPLREKRVDSTCSASSVRIVSSVLPALHASEFCSEYIFIIILFRILYI